MSRIWFIVLASWTLAISGRASSQNLQPDRPASGDGSDLAHPPAAFASAPLDDQQTLLSDIQSQLAALQTQLVRAERRVAVLKEGVLGGPIMATNVVLAHRNEVGGPFVLERVTYTLDGGVIFEEGNARGRLEAEKVIELFDGGLRPGPHQLRVVLEFRGRAVGPFTYLEGYGFRVKSGCNFEVIEGRAHRIDVVASEDNDVSLEPHERLSVRCDVGEDRRPSTSRGAPAPSATGAAPPGTGPEASPEIPSLSPSAPDGR